VYEDIAVNRACFRRAAIFRRHQAGLGLLLAALALSSRIMATGAPDLQIAGSADVQGCQHWGLTALQQQQERYARRIRKAVLFEGAGTLKHLVCALGDGESGARPPRPRQSCLTSAR